MFKHLSVVALIATGISLHAAHSEDAAATAKWNMPNIPECIAQRKTALALGVAGAAGFAASTWGLSESSYSPLGQMISFLGISAAFGTEAYNSYDGKKAWNGQDKRFYATSTAAVLTSVFAGYLGYKADFARLLETASKSASTNEPNTAQTGPSDTASTATPSSSSATSTGSTTE